MAEPPWDKIDEGIRPLVRLLHHEGLQTTSSCQGGRHSEGATNLPQVQVACHRSEFEAMRGKIADAMQTEGWDGFSLTFSDRFDYQKRHEPWLYLPVLLVEPWTLKGQPGTKESWCISS